MYEFFILFESILKFTTKEDLNLAREEGNRNIFATSKLSYCRLAKVERKSHNLRWRNEGKAEEKGKTS